MYGPYSHSWMFGGGSGMFLGGLGMILVWAVPLILLFLAVRFLLRKGHCDDAGTPQDRGALDILKEAYARGEIDRDEYLRKRDDLR